jgi:16S rRNA (guanine(966)-N(2))-methyltransferase RsmD
LRIISGQHKGRTIQVPANFKARPTTDYAKVSLFNIINNYFFFENLNVLDLFAGSGGISYEFASRGCKNVLAIELDPVHYKFITEIGLKLRMQQLHTNKTDAFKYLERCNTKFDIIFADPPYDLKGKEKLHELIFNNNLLEKDGWFILEHGEKEDYSKQPMFWEQRNYGSVYFSIFLQE